ncbi:MAG: sigma-70 family RNA polymerase sigma factor [Candidatus Dormibacteraeota bacterium]|nr:sigma-70 family RNA polymerase sigma factor [Candidatus Dormibacteraeota bacterium]MBV8444808.1 sigma-70 family RNA polymerase sigma factor [Candidatus Dormibacteraeota bacterium]
MDATLWQRGSSEAVADVDTEAEALFAAQLKAVLEAAFRLVRSCGASPDEAADIIQDASIRAWRHRNQRRGDFRPWFLTIAYHEARRPRRRWLTLPAFWVRDDSVVDEPPLSSELAASMRRLSRRHRLALSLRYSADLSTADVARVLGCSEPAAKQLLLRAREGLRTALMAVREETP